MPFIFDYDTFYDYYTDSANLYVDDSPRPTVYFFNRGDIAKPAKSNTISKNYVIINGVKIYIAEVKQTKALLFTIPTNIDGNLFDFHYHFGIRYINPETDPTVIDMTYFYDKMSKKAEKPSKSYTRKRGHKKVILETMPQNIIDEIDADTTPEFLPIELTEQRVYFHKTTQKPIVSGSSIFGANNVSGSLILGTNNHQSCHFQNNTKIKNIRTILCVDENQKHMKMVFSAEEIKQITEIMSRPFTPIPKTPITISTSIGNMEVVYRAGHKNRKRLKTRRRINNMA